MNRLERAADLAEYLTDNGVPATYQAHDLAGMLPAVLVAPPALDWTAGTMAGPEITWTLHVVASTNDPDQAWPELDDLLTALDGPIEPQRATPAALALSGGDPLPSYTVTFAETLGED